MKLLVEVDQIQRLLDTLRDDFINEENEAHKAYLDEKSSDNLIKFAQTKACRMTVELVVEQLQDAVEESIGGKGHDKSMR